MPVLLKSPGAPLYARRLPDGGYELLQAQAGLGSEGVRAHVMEAPAHVAGDPGVWSAREIGPKGPYGRERLVNRNLSVGIGPNGRTGVVRPVRTSFTRPIAAVGDVDQAALAPLPPVNPWVLAALGAAVGFLGLRWLLLRRRTRRNPAWTSEESKLGGQWSIWTTDGEFIGYVLRMPDYFAALNDRGAVIGKMGSQLEAEALVYGNWSYRFGSFDTLVGNPGQKPWFTQRWPEDKAAFETHDVVVRGYGPIGWVYKPSVDSWVPFLELEGRKPEGVMAWAAETLEEASEAIYDKFMAEHAPRMSVKRLAAKGQKRLSQDEIDKRIQINLSRQTVQSRTYEADPKVVQAGRDPDGHPYHTSIMRDVTFKFPKPVSEDRLARMVKGAKSAVIRRAKELARQGVIYGYCHKAPVFIPKFERDAHGRKVVTTERVKRSSKTYCHFATHGPGGELGLFRAGEHPVPEGVKTRLHRGDAVKIKDVIKAQPLYVSRFSLDFEGKLQAYLQPFGPYMTAPSPKEPGEWVRAERLEVVKLANPEQAAFRFSAGPSYIVKERKPQGRGLDGRMFYTRWETVSQHDTLASAKKAATVHCPRGESRRWRRQRAIFLRGKRVSNGPFLLREHKDLPEVPR